MSAEQRAARAARPGGTAPPAGPDLEDRHAVVDRVKRLADVVVAATALVALSPVLAAVAVVVARTLGTPVLFRQERPGLHGVPFVLVKFRTMRVVDAARGRVTNEDRVTPVGQLLRATSLDELPSLWNVLRGDMSLVGPRPLLMAYLPLYTPEQAVRHRVRPGLTGLAQVNGRNALDWESRLALDAQYVATRSIALDLRILAATVAVVLRRDGISSDGSVVGAPFPGSAAPGDRARSTEVSDG